MTLVLALTLLHPGAIQGGGKPQDSKAPTQEQIKAWINELGSKEFKRREAAITQLKKAGTIAIPLVRIAAASKNLEVAARAREVLTYLNWDFRIIRAESELTEATLKTLKRQRVPSSIKEVYRLDDVFRTIASMTRLNVFVDLTKEDAAIEVGPIPAGVSFEDAIKTLLEGTDFTTEICHGVLVLTKKKSRFQTTGLAGPSVAEMDRLLMRGRNQDLVAKLTGKQMTFKLKAMPIEDAFKISAGYLKLDIVFGAEVRANHPFDTCTLELKNVPVVVVLGLICHQSGLDWKIDRAGVIRIIEIVKPDE